MDDFRKNLSAVLLQFGFESPNDEPSDDELIQMVRELGELMETYEGRLGGRQ